MATVANRHRVEQGRIETAAPRQVDARSAPAQESNDFLGTPMPWLLLAVTLLPFIVLTFWMVFAYVGIEFGTPPINTHSVPPPLVY